MRYAESRFLQFANVNKQVAVVVVVAELSVTCSCCTKVICNYCYQLLIGCFR